MICIIYITSKIKELLCVYSGLFKQISIGLHDCHIESKKTWNNPEENLSDFIALLLYWTFISLLSVFIILPVFTILPIIYILIGCFKDWLKSLSAQASLPMLQLSEDEINNIIFKILQENAVELELMPLNSIRDIYPVKYPTFSNINGFPYGRLIAKYKSDSEIDFSIAKEILNTKLFQYFQMHYPNYTYSINGLCVVTIFNIEKDAMHPNYYSFHVMYVNTEEKANYINNLWNNEKIQQMETDELNLFDEDF